MSNTLRITTLGVLQIEQNGVPLTGFISRKVEALLVYLACQPKPHARESLNILFWNDDKPGNLRTALSNLQQQVGSYVTITRQTVAWNADSDYVLDVAELESILNLVEHRIDTNQHFSQFGADRLEETLKLYHGNFLEGFNIRDAQGFEEWYLLEQERIRIRIINSWRLLIRYSYQPQKYERGIQQAREYLRLDPLNEEAYYYLMVMLAETGERTDAMATYWTCQQQLEQNLNIEPSQKLASLADRIAAEEVLIHPKPIKQRGTIPAQATPFVNRPIELRQINERLDDPSCRLLTLVGPGGIGKTRLAMHVAKQWQLDFPDGVYFIELATINDPAMLEAAILSSLKIPRPSKKDTHSQLLTSLSDKKCLIVLDNFENLLERTPLLSEILSQTPQTKILVTSRERLQLQQEWLITIGGLDFPITDTLLKYKYNALELFEQSAQIVFPSFDLNQHLASVLQICRLVEGMPLAIELAAGWLRTISCPQIVEQIQHDLGMLSTTTRDVPERHRSIHKLFDISWNMLTEEEQHVYMSLSVFSGSFSREAALQVADMTLPILNVLVEKSLLRHTSNNYYSLHELLRRYSFERLTVQGNLEQVSAKHAEYYKQQLADVYARVEIGQIVSNFEMDYNNITQALRWVEAQHDLKTLIKICNNMIFFWDLWGDYDAAKHWTSLALEWLKDNTATDLQAHAYLNASYFAWLYGELDQALAWSERGLSIAELHDVKPAIKKGLPMLGHIHKSSGNFDQVRHYYEAALRLAETTQDELGNGRALNNLGNLAIETCDYISAKDYISRSLKILENLNAVERLSAPLGNMGIIAYQEGDYALAEAYFQKSVEIARQTNDRLNMATMLGNLGEVAALRDNLTLAKSALKEGIKTLYEIGNKINQVYAIESHTKVLSKEGQYATAAFLLGAAEAAREQLNTPLPPNSLNEHKSDVDAIRSQLSKEEFLTNWHKGRVTSLEDVVIYILYEI